MSGCAVVTDIEKTMLKMSEILHAEDKSLNCLWECFDLVEHVRSRYNTKYSSVVEIN